MIDTMKTIKIYSLILLCMTILNSHSYASNCQVSINANNFNSKEKSNYEISILNEGTYQSFIKIKDATIKNNEDVKTVFIAEKVAVPNLTHEQFLEISSDPVLIAQILGGKIINKKSNDNFRISLPAVLGLNVSFDAKVNKQKDNKIKITADNFNTLFLQGDGEISIDLTSSGDVIIQIQGTAFIPKSAGRVFIFGVGGENNFKKLVQEEVDDQIKKSLANFKNLN